MLLVDGADAREIVPALLLRPSPARPEQRPGLELALVQRQAEPERRAAPRRLPARPCRWRRAMKAQCWLPALALRRRRPSQPRQRSMRPRSPAKAPRRQVLAARRAVPVPEWVPDGCRSGCRVDRSRSRSRYEPRRHGGGGDDRGRWHRNWRWWRPNGRRRRDWRWRGRGDFSCTDQRALEPGYAGGRRSSHRDRSWSLDRHGTHRLRPGHGRLERGLQRVREERAPYQTAHEGPGEVGDEHHQCRLQQECGHLVFSFDAQQVHHQRPISLRCRST